MPKSINKHPYILESTFRNTKEENMTNKKLTNKTNTIPSSYLTGIKFSSSGDYYQGSGQHNVFGFNHEANEVVAGYQDKKRLSGVYYYKDVPKQLQYNMMYEIDNRIPTFNDNGEITIGFNAQWQKIYLNYLSGWWAIKNALNDEVFTNIINKIFIPQIKLKSNMNIQKYETKFVDLVCGLATKSFVRWNTYALKRNEKIIDISKLNKIFVSTKGRARQHALAEELNRISKSMPKKELKEILKKLA